MPCRLERDLVLRKKGGPPATQPSNDMGGEAVGKGCGSKRLGGELGGVAVELGKVLACGVLERLREKVRAGCEVVGRGREGNSGDGGDGSVCYRPGSLPTDNREHGSKDSRAAGLAARSPDWSLSCGQCPPVRLRPITPTTISPMLLIRTALTGSPSATIPMAAIAAVPIPAQTA